MKKISVFGIFIFTLLIINPLTLAVAQDLPQNTKDLIAIAIVWNGHNCSEGVVWGKFLWTDDGNDVFLVECEYKKKSETNFQYYVVKFHHQRQLIYITPK